MNRLEQRIKDYENLDCPKIVVGNKAEDMDAREVYMENGMVFSDKYGMEYYETRLRSVKHNDGIEETLSSLIIQIIRRIPEPPDASMLLDSNIKIGYDLTREENIAYRKALFEPKIPDELRQKLTNKMDWL
ncbi:hypothetical protein ROZALSC1DRAFT_31507 [Rozella allomycis CSF55]|uniref:Uncharacterized protein n=1 Tax=Rozella allomycis (strain CSF55) TaxID=988480 RepID=A0A4P9YBC5_ROZAC|nr:hypothetical protein ROZALSC1DRAFT_31507 [Rozella allomycis CSF55]